MTGSHRLAGPSAVAVFLAVAPPPAALELKWNQARAGAGLAWRMLLPPGECDNGLDAALTKEF